LAFPEEKSGKPKSVDPNRKADALPNPDEDEDDEGPIGENGLPGYMSSEKKVLIEVGDSLNDDGGDGESAVDPLPPIPTTPAGRVNLPR
jgi:hypothetical protein